MKKLIVAVAVIFLICSAVYAQDDCETEYLNLINELKNSKILDVEKEKYLPPLKKALQLCREGKIEQAEKIVDDLNDQGLSEEIFDTHDGN